MKFGMMFANVGDYATPSAAIEFAQLCEDIGIESLWAVEHTVVPKNYASTYPYSADGKMAGGQDDFVLPDPLIWLAYVAAATTKIKLATGVLILPQHNPVITAKQVATIDHLSGGRMMLGVGVGWMKEEFDAIGAPFEKRGKRTDEYVAAMRELWSAKQPSYAGEFVNFTNAYCLPQPVDKRVPIVIGGDSDAAARRAGRLGDGYFPIKSLPTERIALMRETALAEGRDPDAIELSTLLMPNKLDRIPELAEQGISRVVLPSATGAGTLITSEADVAHWRDAIARYAGI